VSDLQNVAAFRERLASYLNVVQQSSGRNVVVSEDTRRHLAIEQAWLNREYGRLHSVVNRWGGAQMLVPAIGVASPDVIRDAINEVGRVYYGDIARYAVQHLDNVIGRLDAQANQRRIDSDTVYRLSSPVYWFQMLGRLLGWLLGTVRGRIVAIVTALVLAMASGIVSGAAQAWFEQILN